MTTVNFEKLSCPSCGTLFMASVLGSYGSAGMHTDFCPVYTGAPAVFHLLAACPSCGFTAYLDRFDFVEEEMPDEYCVSEEDFDIPEEDTSLYGPAKYLKAVETYKDLGESDEALADLYLKAYWCFHFEDFPDVDREKCLGSAIYHLQEALDDFEGDDGKLQEYRYLAGELSRRAGRFAEAAEWLEKVEGPDESLVSLAGRMRRLALAGDASDGTV